MIAVMYIPAIIQYTSSKYDFFKWNMIHEVHSAQGKPAEPGPHVYMENV